MRYRGNMRDVRDAMVEAHNALGRLAEISSNVARAAGGRTRGGVGGLGLSSFASSSVPDSGSSSAVSSSKPNTSGGTTTVYQDGTVIITNAQGQDVTSNFIKNPAPLTTLQKIALGVDENVVQPTATALANSDVLNGLANNVKAVALLGLVGVVIYVMWKTESKQ